MPIHKSAAAPPLPKGAMVACGNRLSPTGADSGDGDRVSGGGILSPLYPPEFCYRKTHPPLGKGGKSDGRQGGKKGK